MIPICVCVDMSALPIPSGQTGTPHASTKTRLSLCAWFCSKKLGVLREELGGLKTSRTVVKTLQSKVATPPLDTPTFHAMILES